MKSQDRLLAQRYAVAYDGLATDNAHATAQYADLRAAQQALDCARGLMQDPCVALTTKIDLVQDALKAAPQTAAFVALLLQSKRYFLLEEITLRVAELLDARLGIVRARVESAFELSDSLKAQTKAALEARFGGKADITYTIRPELIGGLKIWCQGELIDASLLGRFNKLQEVLTQ